MHYVRCGGLTRSLFSAKTQFCRYTPRVFSVSLALFPSFKEAKGTGNKSCTKEIMRNVVCLQDALLRMLSFMGLIQMIFSSNHPVLPSTRTVSVQYDETSDLTIVKPAQESDSELQILQDYLEAHRETIQNHVKFKKRRAFAKMLARVQCPPSI